MEVKKLKEFLKKIFHWLREHELFTALLLFGAFTLIYFFPVTLNKSTLFTPGDGNFMSYGPWQYIGKVRYWCMDSWGYMLNEFPGTILIKQYLKEGVAPLWNPYGGAGAPLISSSQTGLWNIFHIPMYFINSPKAFDFYLMSKMLIAALFTYIFLRELGLRKESSAFGAIAYGFSGFFMTWLNLWFLTIDSFLPLVLYLTLKYIKTENLKWMILNGLIVAALIFMGNVQPVLLISVFMAVFYLAYDNLLVKMWREKNIKLITKPIKGFLSTFLLAFIITLPYIIEFARDLSLAWNIHHPGVSAIHMSDIRSMFGFWFTPYKAFNHYQYGPIEKGVYIMYLGSIATFMAGLGIFTKDKVLRRTIIAFGIFCFFILSKITFNPFYTSWIDHVPFFNQIAYTKYLATFFFSVAFAGAIGVDGILKNEHKVSKLILSTGFFVFLAIIYLIKRNGFIENYYFFYTFPVITTFIFALAALGLCIFTLVIAGEHFNHPQKKLFISMIGWLFVAAIAFESFVYSPIYRLPQAHNPIKEPPYVQKLKDLLRDENYYRVAPYYLTMAPSMQWIHRIQSINMFDAIMPQRFYDFSEKLIGGSTNFYMITHDKSEMINNRFIDLLGAKYFLSEKYLPGDNDKEIIYDNETKIYKNNSVMPRAFIAYNYVVTSSNEVLDKLKEPTFDIKNKVVLEGSIPNVSAFEKNIVPAQIIKYSENKIDIEAKTEQPGVLVLTDMYYPQWAVYVDGKKKEIIPVDYIFRGVVLDSGVHKIEFVYEPKTFLTLIILSLSFVCISIFLLIYKKNEKN